MVIEFTNGREMLKLAKSRNFTQLRVAAKEAKIKVCDNYIHIKDAAYCVYFTIKSTMHDDQEAWKFVSKCLTKILADVWYVSILLKVRDNEECLSEEAKEVLKKYDEYVSVAKEMYHNSKEKYFDIKACNDEIIVKAQGDRLCFIKNGEPHTIYHHDDKYDFA